MGIFPVLGRMLFSFFDSIIYSQGGDLARSNYSFKKRQKELAKKKKKEEKRKRRLEKKGATEEALEGPVQDEGEKDPS
jgi:hypothetical protein